MKADYPDVGVAGLMAEVVGDYVYLGMGYYDAFDWWRYDPRDHTWLEIASFPGGFTTGWSSFIIQNKIFLVAKTCWEYDPATNEWTQRTSHPVGRNSAIAFGLNGKGYLATGIAVDSPTGIFVSDFWEFDPE